VPLAVPPSLRTDRHPRPAVGSSGHHQDGSPAGAAQWHDRLPADRDQSGSRSRRERGHQGPGQPALVRVVSVPSGCTVTVGTLAAGERTHLSINIRVKHGHVSITVIGNCAAVYSTTPSPNVANNQSCATTVARSPSTDVSVVKEGPATAPAGGTIEYSITVTNHGPLTATDVVVRDPE
jgi:hypothetical protein